MKVFLYLFLSINLYFANLLSAAEVFQNKVYVSNFGSNSVSVWDTTKPNEPAKIIKIGEVDPTFLVLKSDGKRLYVLDAFGVNIISTESMTVLKRINFNRGTFPQLKGAGRPSNLAITSDDKFVYINITDDHTGIGRGDILVAVLNTETDIIDRFIPIKEGRFVAQGITIANNEIFVGYNESKPPNPQSNASISIIDNSTNKVTETILIGDKFGPSLAVAITEPLKIYGGLAEPNGLAKLAIIKFDGTDYISTNKPVNFWGLFFAPSQKHQRMFATDARDIFMINTSNESVKQFVINRNPFGIALNHDENILYVADNTNNKVLIYDIVGNDIIPAQPAFFKVGSKPYGVAVGPSSQTPKVVVLPPTHLKGKVIENRFLTQTDLTVRLTWKPSPDLSVIIYNVFRNDELIGTVLADSKLEFDDHNREEDKTYTYMVEALITEDQVSKPISITIKT
ncbi:MAG: YncE family protein [Parachlamydiaceae bacterium]|nr:YncE family protein [Parachlamydiaceae bacterium]